MFGNFLIHTCDNLILGPVWHTILLKGDTYVYLSSGLMCDNMDYGPMDSFSCPNFIYYEAYSS